MQSVLRDGPRLIGDLWDRQIPLVDQTLQSAGLADLTADFSSDTTLHDLLQDIPRQLCRRLRFRRGWLWLNDHETVVAVCGWPPGSHAGRLRACACKALKGEATLSAGPAPKCLCIPLRAWSGEVCGVVALERPVLDRAVTARERALGDRYGEVASGALHRAQLAQTLADSQRLLESKTTALRESHHRIKNNLQAVAGLLAATGVRANSRPVREALGESAARVKAIAAVHEALLVGGDGDADLRALVAVLRKSAWEPLLASQAPVRIRADLPEHRIGGRAASALALVLNELVTNALRHACAQNGGEIRVAFRCGEEAMLTVSDDGGGLAPGPVPESRYGLGLHIVRSIVCHDLGGCFEIRGGEQTVATARCPASALCGASPAAGGLSLSSVAR